MNDVLGDLSHHLTAVGLCLRGSFVENTEEESRSFVLIGNLGGTFWSSFEQSGVSGDNALDRWTKSVLDPIAEKVGALALYPFSQPPLPFLTWAKRAEGLRSSPLGLSIHPEYGLWHAYRAAFVFEGMSFDEGLRARAHPCDTCQDKPCLTACPVNAFQTDQYDYLSCIDHVVSDGALTCGSQGCLARRACPVGQEHEYSKAQQVFHMKAFVAR